MSAFKKSCLVENKDIYKHEFHYLFVCYSQNNYAIMCICNKEGIYELMHNG